MTGLLILILSGGWLTVVLSIAGAVARKGAEPKPLAMYWLVVLVLLPLPLLDELIGKVQFKSLCSNSRVELTPGSRGKTVRLHFSRVRVPNMILPTSQLRWRYNDVKTGEVVLAYDTLRSRGGILARTLGLSEAKVPFTFRHSCEPGGVDYVDYVLIFKENEISLVDPLL
jgi:hypothetical protein